MVKIGPLLKEGRPGIGTLGYRDFIPRSMRKRLFRRTIACGGYESFDAAVAAASEWIQREGLHLINVETVWQGEGLHPLVRVWYQTGR